ncbi:toprim domain-containing protein [Gemmata sp. SH-PL17]|uniref:toprim domain-containing protein n=1 Tax=Gemmata sp. SH-PL17 TaxID=1630693 RepID=UPI00138FD759|nr:toprim domain-containing protein [Gemmata sp. SH-PL17]
MSYWNDINNRCSHALLETNRLGELLSELGCDLKETRGGNFRGPCPIHGGWKHNFEVYTGGEQVPIYWRCYSHQCHTRPGLVENLLGLVRGALSGDPDRPAPIFRAKEFVNEFVARGPHVPRSAPRPKKAPVRNCASWTREQVRSRLAIPSPYFVGRGFNPTVLDRLDIGESSRLGCAVVPIYDDCGDRCVGHIERAVHSVCDACGLCHPVGPCAGGRRRWNLPARFYKGDWLYNYAVARQAPEPYVLLVEGVTDVLRAAEAGVPAVATFGTDVTVAQEVKLGFLNKSVVVAFDNDEAGHKAAASLVPILSRACRRVVLQHPPAGFKDVGEMSVEAVKAWLGPRPYEVAGTGRLAR